MCRRVCLAMLWSPSGSVVLWQLPPSNCLLCWGSARTRAACRLIIFGVCCLRFCILELGDVEPEVVAAADVIHAVAVAVVLNLAETVALLSLLLRL